MKILFSCLGFSSCEVLVEREGRQHHIGWLMSKGSFLVFEIFENGLWERWLHKSELPSPDAIQLEYQIQLADKGVWINKEIERAG